MLILLLAVITITRPAGAALPASLAALVVACVLLAASTFILSGGGHPPMFQFASSLIGVLAVRGNVFASCVAAVMWLVIVTVLSTSVEATGITMEHVLVSALVIVVGLFLRWRIQHVVARMKEHDRLESRVSTIVVMHQQAAARTTAELAEFLQIAGPTLLRLSKGLPLDAALLDEARIAEATIRDQLQVPRLHVPILGRAVRAARARGVSVLILGEPVDDRPRVGNNLASSISSILGDVTEGRVVIRLMPPRYAAAVAIRIERPAGFVRKQLDSDGIVIDLGREDRMAVS